MGVCFCPSNLWYAFVLELHGSLHKTTSGGTVQCSPREIGRNKHCDCLPYLWKELSHLELDWQNLEQRAKSCPLIQVFVETVLCAKSIEPVSRAASLPMLVGVQMMEWACLALMPNPEFLECTVKWPGPSKCRGLPGCLCAWDQRALRWAAGQSTGTSRFHRCPLTWVFFQKKAGGVGWIVCTPRLISIQGKMWIWSWELLSESPV